MTSYFLYLTICLLWGLFVIGIQHKLKYPRVWYNPLVAVFIVNILLAPFCILFAINHEKGFGN